MKKPLIRNLEEYAEPTKDGVVGTATIDLDGLPDDFKFPSNATFAKRFRKLKAYERIWEAACNAHQAGDRDSARYALRKVADPVDFILYLLEYFSESTDTSKAGGDAKNIDVKVMANRARRLYTEHRDEAAAKGMKTSQSKFAELHHEVLASHYRAAMDEFNKKRRELDEIVDKINQGELDKEERKRLLKEKSHAEAATRSVPTLPTVKTIQSWLKGL